MKRGQIKMMETIGVLLVFFILLAFGLVFYADSQKRSFQKELQEKNTLEAIGASQQAAFLPELRCEEDQAAQCVDLLKLEVLVERIKNDQQLRVEYYAEQFGFANISIRQVYPPGKTYIIYENVPQDRKATFQSFKTFYPLHIQNVTREPITHSAFGVLEAEVIIS